MRTATGVGVSAQTLRLLGERAIPGVRLTEAPSADIEVLWRRQYDRTRWFTDALAASPSVRWAHTDTAGVDRLPLNELHRCGVQLSNARGVYTEPVSQWIIAAVLLAAKRLDETVRHGDRRTWQEVTGTIDLAGTTMLLIGFGAIGKAVGRIAGALGMRVVGVVRQPRPGREGENADVIVSVSEDWRVFLPETSFLVVTAPLTAETVGMIGAAELARLRFGSWLINAGRGGIVDEPALCDALDQGSLGGAALDVFATEPLPPGHPLWGRSNVLISPHVASRSPRTDRLALEHFGREIQRYRANLPLVSLVDPIIGY
ncbi:D-2-hydroxyacid dehydrogenase [Micromonospora sp. BQ11]|uniref:D-2-hydroxyacid dehydrogenase n=1 Tax=Micromonospora sp. BQ11 TaxID=3452212 RepID=UPI003F892661